MNKWKVAVRLIILGVFLLIFVAIFVLPRIYSPGVVGGKTIRVGDRGIYDIVFYNIPESYEVTNLYVATIKPKEDLCKAVKRSFSDSNCDYAIHVFRVEDEKNEYENSLFTFPLVDLGKIYMEVYASENNKDSFGYITPDNSMFEVLSSMTSPDNPMYVVGAGDNIYYVIGDVAYVHNYGCILYDRLPAIAMPEEEVIVVEIPLGNE